MTAMRKVKSCGVLVFRSQPSLSFLLMKHPRRYDLPKGHLEHGETELDCALRELREETGIPADAIQLDLRFKHEEIYYPRYKRYGGDRVEKTLVIFLAHLEKDRRLFLTEHRGYEWVAWRPPHAIQPQTVDALLSRVERHFAEHGVIAARPPVTLPEDPNP